MIQSVLIANRGEIAVRISQTAKRMGIVTYGIRSSKEPKAYYLSEVDHIIDFPENSSTQPEFLQIDELIQIALNNKVDAIHPGYGYLSENAEMARKCHEREIIFIGPDASIIQKMGDKLTAKACAIDAGVPVLGGSSKPAETFAEACEMAKQTGYPLIIKAAAGGGGRGMRIVYDQEDLETNLKLASSEADRAFGNATVFIEKYLESPKHIEIQIVADNFGNVIHLGERECSVQRKHQKVIEEAPSSALNSALREKMTNSAIALAREVNYTSLGTVEFLLDEDGSYYFMEMNTRIQVEHPVTELITGIDLVELQFHIASGLPLPITQPEVDLNGWAIECRINAEDPQSNFVPSTGSIRRLRFPAGNDIRVDSGIIAGSEVTPWFDSMLAKIIVYGTNRKQAIERAMQALRDFHISGIKTSVPFCKAVIMHDKFRNGSYNTAFIEKDLKEMVFEEPNEEFMAGLFSVLTHINKTTPKTGDNNKIDPWVLNRRIRHL
ncbi:2-oxoglutarate carboxylase small subunit [Salinivirga cyanobacteriivorans]|uniref:biotin carboxylase n=1 Tax=Salinivirga cyanobacteriivorans TaxID=1307839 RepID=A0A0S2I4M4_9BACT|nr:biotin carboxylase N-terminal domain-containing protein [Salinivirga cyanobacteriivorans]ALO17347.1 2-oxoglutarate carboxylase small subunit [Salinivirga cyanobacteriivorans]